jgi:hypothetical protein
MRETRSTPVLKFSDERELSNGQRRCSAVREGGSVTRESSSAAIQAFNDEGKPFSDHISRPTTEQGSSIGGIALALPKKQR